MNDTSPKMESKMREMMKKKTPGERVKMGCSMFDMAKQLVVSGIREKTPNLSPLLLKKEIFLRFYGGDFDVQTREKILNHLK